VARARWTLTRADGTAVTASVAYDGTPNTATLTPTAPLDASTTYTTALDTTVKAADGTPLAASVSSSFTTAAASAPTVTSKIPTDANVLVTAKVKATFSRAMDPATITSSSFTLK